MGNREVYIVVKIKYMVPELDLKRFEYYPDFYDILDQILGKCLFYDRKIPKVKHDFRYTTIKFMPGNIDFQSLQLIEKSIRQIIYDDIFVSWDQLNNQLRQIITSNIKTLLLINQVLLGQAPLTNPILIRSKIVYKH